MTEGPPRHHEEPMCIRVWLEVGHACEPRQTSSGRALSLDWRVWVRGARGDISAFVHKVVFHLHPPSAFVYPKRVLQEPPYEIKESGCASIDIPIHVYLKFSSKPKKICLRYSLHIENNRKANSESRCVYYDFENPSETLQQALMKGGGEVIARTGGFDHAGKLVVLLPAGERPDPRTAGVKKYKYVKPIRCKHAAERPAEPRVLDEVCPKCGESMTADLRRQLRAAAMTDDEMSRVSQLYLAYGGYERAADGLRLPPLSDPIYRPPELPPSLRRALASVEADYAMQ